LCFVTATDACLSSYFISDALASDSVIKCFLGEVVVFFDCFTGCWRD